MQKIEGTNGLSSRGKAINLEDKTFRSPRSQREPTWGRQSRQSRDWGRGAGGSNTSCRKRNQESARKKSEALSLP